MKQEGNILSGERYPWTAVIEGDDIVVRGQHGTWFGGSDDPLDDGQTASGISTKSNPNYLGCALPIDFTAGILGRLNLPHNPCHGSPLPRLHWGTNVEVTNRDNGMKGICKLIDIGPSAPPVATAAIDLTQAFFVSLGQPKSHGTINVDFRIIGGAKIAGLFGAAIPDSGITITPEFGPSQTV